MIYTIHCCFAIKSFNQSETTITLELGMAGYHKVQFNTFIVLANYQVQIKSKSGIVFVLPSQVIFKCFLPLFNCLTSGNAREFGEDFFDSNVIKKKFFFC